MRRYALLFSLLVSCSVLSVSVSAEEGDLNKLANSAVDKAKSTISYAIGDDMPDWAKRIEWNLGLNEDYNPTGSILTVQPLWQDKEKKHTFFTQLSYFNYEQFNDRKNTTNLGFGYRHVTYDNALLLGGNVFWDHEWDEGHDRLGLGLEAKMAMLDFTANYYNALSGAKNVAGTDKERALDGYDLELRSQIPYMSWARAGIGYYSWDSVDFSDVYGIKASLDMDLSPNFALEAGFTEDHGSRSDRQFFANIIYSFGSAGKARALSDNTGTLLTHGFDEVAFVKRDMRDQTLNKVRRQNKIITERNSAGVTISRAN